MPPEAITLDIPYLRVQSGPVDADSKRLRVVAFHGTPATAEQYQSLAEALAAICDVDFIAPTFPGEDEVHPPGNRSSMRERLFLV